MRITLVSGVVLLALSGGPLVAIVGELHARSVVHHRYVIDPLNSWQPRGPLGLEATVGGHDVSISDTVEGAPNQEGRAAGKLHIAVDGRDYSSAVPVEVRVNERGANRYWLVATLCRVTDRDEAKEYLVAAQSLVPHPGWKNPRARWSDDLMQYRLVWVGQDGSVREEIFGFADRSQPPIRGAIAALVTNHPIGIRSNALSFMPSYVFPLFYPLATSALGGLLVVVGIARGISRTRQERRAAELGYR